MRTYLSSVYGICELVLYLSTPGACCPGVSVKPFGFGHWNELVLPPF